MRLKIFFRPHFFVNNILHIIQRPTLFTIRIFGFSVRSTMRKYGDLFYAMLYIFLQYVSVINKPIANAKKSFLVIVVSVSYSIGLDHTPIEPLPIVMDTLREVANQKS